MERLERQQPQLELDALWDAKPVKAVPQHVLDVVVQCFFAPTSNRAAVCSVTAYFEQINDDDDDDDDSVYLSVCLLIQDLVSFMLEETVEGRGSAAELLNHPWLSVNYCSQSLAC